jgi:hypothetical protein
MKVMDGNITPARITLLVGALIALIVLGPRLLTAISVLYGSDYEILYDDGLGVSTCSPILESYIQTDADRCLTLYYLEIANSGAKPQENVHLVINNLPEYQETSYQSGSLVASIEHTKRPRTILDQSEGGMAINIHDFQPNTLVTIKFSVYGRANLEQLKKRTISISARGHVIEAGPRSTKFMRAMWVIFGVFI